MNTPNILNERYGKLLAVEFVGYRNHKATWKCKCDCGNETVTTANLLRTGKTKSCGCLKTTDKRLPNKLFNDVYRSYKRHADDRGLSFELTQDEFYKLTQTSCFYCGAEPSTIRKQGERSFVYNGVDRVNNNMGYSKENAVSCCKTCNSAKSDRDAIEFLNWIKRVYVHNFSN